MIRSYTLLFQKTSLVSAFFLVVLKLVSISTNSRFFFYRSGGSGGGIRYLSKIGYFISHSLKSMKKIFSVDLVHLHIEDAICHRSKHANYEFKWINAKKRFQPKMSLALHWFVCVRNLRVCFCGKCTKSTENIIVFIVNVPKTSLF